ncbi:MAG TPA: protease pro-enzyme activation domain-containing protein, partial [Variovorax sp.]
MASTAPSHRVPIANSMHHLPAGSVAVRQTNPNARIELTIGVRRKKDLPELASLEQTAPAKRQYMTRKELRDVHGSDPTAVDRIKAFASAHGMTVLREDPCAARLTLAGAVDDVASAFDVKLFDYKHPTLGEFHARVG